MSWYDSGYRGRAPVAVYNAGASGSYDASISVPAGWDAFWTLIQSDGDDVRVTTSNGVTLATYQWSGFVYSTRSGSIELDNVSLIAGGTTLFYLYFRNASAAAGSGSFVAASPKTGTIVPYNPAGGRLARYEQERPGAAVPRTEWTKNAAESFIGWFDFSPALVRARQGARQHDQYDEIASITYDVQTGGASQASMFDASSVLVMDRGLVGVLVKAGTTNTNYTVICTVTTTLGYIYQARAKLRVRTVAE